MVTQQQAQQLVKNKPEEYSATYYDNGNIRTLTQKSEYKQYVDKSGASSKGTYNPYTLTYWSSGALKYKETRYVQKRAREGGGYSAFIKVGNREYFDDKGTPTLKETEQHTDKGIIKTKTNYQTGKKITKFESAELREARRQEEARAKNKSDKPPVVKSKNIRTAGGYDVKRVWTRSDEGLSYTDERRDTAHNRSLFLSNKILVKDDKWLGEAKTSEYIKTGIITLPQEVKPVEETPSKIQTKKEKSEFEKNISWINIDSKIGLNTDISSVPPPVNVLGGAPRHQETTLDYPKDDPVKKLFGKVDLSKIKPDLSNLSDYTPKSVNIYPDVNKAQELINKGIPTTRPTTILLSKVFNKDLEIDEAIDLSSQASAYKSLNQGTITPQQKADRLIFDKLTTETLKATDKGYLKDTGDVLASMVFVAGAGQGLGYVASKSALVKNIITNPTAQISLKSIYYTSEGFNVIKGTSSLQAGNFQEGTEVLTSTASRIAGYKLGGALLKQTAGKPFTSANFNKWFSPPDPTIVNKNLWLNQNIITTTGEGFSVKDLGRFNSINNKLTPAGQLNLQGYGVTKVKPISSGGKLTIPKGTNFQIIEGIKIYGYDALGNRPVNIRLDERGLFRADFKNINPSDKSLLSFNKDFVKFTPKYYKGYDITTNKPVKFFETDIRVYKGQAQFRTEKLFRGKPKSFWKPLSDIKGIEEFNVFNVEPPDTHILKIDRFGNKYIQDVNMEFGKFNYVPKWKQILLMPKSSNLKPYDVSKYKTPAQKIKEVFLKSSSLKLETLTENKPVQLSEFKSIVKVEPVIKYQQVPSMSDVKGSVSLKNPVNIVQNEGVPLFDLSAFSESKSKTKTSTAFKIDSKYEYGFEMISPTKSELVDMSESTSDIKIKPNLSIDTKSDLKPFSDIKIVPLYDISSNIKSNVEITPKIKIDTKLSQETTQQTEQAVITTTTPSIKLKTNTLQTFNNPIVEPPPPINKPSLSFDDDSSKKLESGFVAFVRVKGKFKRASEILSEKEALKFGADVVANTSSATFKVEKANSLISSKLNKKIDFDVEADFKDFYRKGNLFIEKKERRIKSQGELKEITFKGIRASKNKGFVNDFFGKPKKSKKKKDIWRFKIGL